MTTHPARHGLVEALRAVRGAITDPVNNLSVVCTVWMPQGSETVVDFIDAAIDRAALASEAASQVPADGGEEWCAPPEGYETWQDFLANPPPPTPALREVFRKYRENQERVRPSQVLADGGQDAYTAASEQAAIALVDTFFIELEANGRSEGIREWAINMASRAIARAAAPDQEGLADGK